MIRRMRARPSSSCKARRRSARPARPAAAGEQRLSPGGRGQVLAVAVDRLAEQRDHARALVDHPARLVDELGDRPREHPAAHARHDAERAVQVAAAHHRQPPEQAARVDGSPSRGSSGRSSKPVSTARAARGRAPAARRARTSSTSSGRCWKWRVPTTRSTCAERRKSSSPTRSRHAAHDADQELGPALLRALELAEPGVHALLGVVAHRAGVEDHQVGLGDLARRAPAAPAEAALDELRVVLVHLAAEGDHVQPGAGPHAGRGLQAGPAGLDRYRLDARERHGGDSARRAPMA